MYKLNYKVMVETPNFRVIGLNSTLNSVVWILLPQGFAANLTQAAYSMITAVQ